jgi:alpha-L-arabinofuranosidase
VDLSLQGFAAGAVIDHQVMTHADLKAVNTATNQQEVAPRRGSGATVANGTLSLKAAPYSYQMVRVKV